MRIGICNDHRGLYRKKELVLYLEHEGYEVVDFGSNVDESVDFPEFALKLGEGISNKRVNRGIAICGTGIGMSIALNKVKGVYCAKVNTINESVLSRQHNNANCIALSADLDLETAYEIIDKFLETEPLKDGKYARRNKMIKDYENNG